MTPSSTTARTALHSARSYLDDNTAVTYSDARLFPMLQIAHQELSAKLLSNGIGVSQQQSAIITVPALNTALGQTGPIAMQGTPSNMIFPLTLSECNVGDDVEFFEQMQQTSFPPNIDPTSYLIYWSWIGQQIMLVGATSDKWVQIRYRAGLTSLQSINDNLGFIYAELYLGPRVASLALPNRKDLKDTAEANLFTVINYNVVADQGTPKRRVGYRRAGANRRVF